jgi:hypothetical protein
MDVIELHMSVIMLKTLGYSLALVFAARAMYLLNKKKVKVNLSWFVAPLAIFMASPLFDIFNEIYGIHELQHASLIAEAMAAFVLAIAFMDLSKKLERFKKR